MADICGHNSTPIPAGFVGCGKSIEGHSYRCTHCDVAFHKECANAHFKTEAVVTDEMIRAIESGAQSWSDRIAALERELAAAQSYATTLAVSMHRQHYAEDAPNWQPLPDLVGLLTQIDNMYAGLRNDLEALKVENKRLVGLPLASLRAEREQAIAEVECLWVAIQSHCSAATIKAIESELESK